LQVKVFLPREKPGPPDPLPIDFTFKTDPLEASKCDFAVMGNEANGKYYEATKG
jgi:hypothetical protein